MRLDEIEGLTSTTKGVEKIRNWVLDNGGSADPVKENGIFYGSFPGKLMDKLFTVGVKKSDYEPRQVFVLHCGDHRAEYHYSDEVIDYLAKRIGAST